MYCAIIRHYIAVLIHFGFETWAISIYLDSYLIFIK